MLVKEILDTARQTPGYAGEAPAAAAPPPPGAGPQFVELHSGSTGGGSTGGAACASTGDSDRQRGSQQGLGPHDGEVQRVSFDRPESLGRAPAAAAAAAEGQGEVSQRPPGAGPQASVTGEALPDAAALVASAAASGGPQPSMSAVGSGSGGSSQRRAAPLGVVPQVSRAPDAHSLLAAHPLRVGAACSTPAWVAYPP